jgi:hypothetical protein
MGKVWNFEGNGVDNLTPLKELMSDWKYDCAYSETRINDFLKDYEDI